jgi:branched-chain amino acid aminotransferase
MGIEDRVLWIDGRWVPAAEATVSVLSHSMQRGSLVFDVYTVVDVGGRPHGLAAREHTERFLRSAREMGLQVPYGVDALLEVAAELVAANAGCDTVRLSAYFAEPTFDLLPAVDRATVAVAAYAWGDLHPSSRGGEPARLALPGTRKVPNDVLPVQAKAAASYAHAALAKAAARAAGFHDVLLLDGQHGGIGESGTMSFFLVVHGAIHVPGLDAVLDGITRRATLEIAESEGIGVEVATLPLELIGQAQEAFLASTSRHIWPVAQVGEVAIPGPHPGPVTARLMARFDALVAGTDPLSARWLQPL